MLNEDSNTYNNAEKNQQKGEIATVLTLVGLGVVIIGMIVGGKLVKEGPKLEPKAAVPAMTATPTPNPVLRAFWKFDEGTGDRVRDRSGHGHGGDWMEDGSDFSDNWVSDKNNLLWAGSFQRAKFSRVRVLDADDLDIRRSLTISAWVYPKSVDQEQGAPILAKGTGGAGMAYLFDFVQRPIGNVAISRNIRFFANSADGNNNNDKTCEAAWMSNQKVNTWSYLSAVYEWKAGDAGKITLYDGDTPLETCENISSTLISVNTSPITLGSRKSSGTSGFDMNYSGYLDEVRLYNKALTLSEIRDNMNEMIIIPTPTVTPTPTPTVTVTPTPTIPAPTAYAATNITSTSFTANWSASAGATSYKLDVALSSNFTSGFISGCAGSSCNNFDVGNVTSYPVTQSCFDLAPVYYRVRALNASGTSTNSSVISVTRIPCAPDALPPPPLSSQSTDSSITAVWSGAYAATGYYLDVATDSGFTPELFVLTGCEEGSCNNKDVGRVGSYSVTGLAPDTTYYYRLRSYNASGTSGNSNTRSRTTTSAITPTPTVTLTPTPTVTLTPTPSVTLIPTSTSTPTPTVTNTPTPTVTNTPTPTVTLTPTPTVTPSPTPTVTLTPTPSVTITPTPTPTVTLTPTPTVTLTPTPTVTPSPTPTVTLTPTPSVTITPTPTPTVTLTPTPTVTLTPTASVTPIPNAPVGVCETYIASSETTPVTWTWESSDVGLQVYDDTGMWWYNSTATSGITISSKDNAGIISGIPPGRIVYAKTTADWDIFSPIGQVICPMPSPTVTITPTPTVTLTPTPTVTLTPTPTVTPSPTPTVTLTPTPSVTITPTPTPTVTLTPTPTVTLTPTPTVTPSPTPTVTLTPTPSVTITPSPTPSCPNGEKGNLNCSTDRCIDTTDWELFTQFYNHPISAIPPLPYYDLKYTPDLVVDTFNWVDTADYEIFRQNFGTCN